MYGSSPLRSTLNTNVITGLGICKVCTEAAHCVAHNVRVQSATQWAASVHTLQMPKPVITFVFKVLRNGLLRYILTHAQTCDNVRVSKCYAMGCFGTYFTDAQACDNVRVSKCYAMGCFGTYFTHVQNLWERSCWKWLSQWTASVTVHTVQMPKSVITFVFKVLRNGLLRQILCTCPNLW